MKKLRWWLAAGLPTICLTIPLAPHFVPLPSSLANAPKSGVRFTDRTGRVLRESLVDGRRFITSAAIGQLPSHFLAATIYAEDKRFWSHHGIDPLAILRATANAIRDRRIVSGASTISQQLIKIAQPRRRNLGSKLIEALQAVRLEQIWKKPQILQAYLDRVDYGNSRIGIAAAAEY